MNWGVFPWKYHFSRNHAFFCKVVFMAHFQVSVLFYLHNRADAASFSWGFYQPGEKHNRSYLQGGGFYFCFMPEGRSGKMLKNAYKYHVSHFQLSKIFWFIRFSSSFGGIFILTVWGTSYFSLPVPEFPEMMLCLTLSCVAK